MTLLSLTDELYSKVVARLKDDYHTLVALGNPFASRVPHQYLQMMKAIRLKQTPTKQLVMESWQYAMTHKSKGWAQSTKFVDRIANWFGWNCKNEEFLKMVLYCILCDPKFNIAYHDVYIEGEFDYAIAVYANQNGGVAAIGFEVRQHGGVRFLTPDGVARAGHQMTIPDWIAGDFDLQETVAELRRLLDPTSDGYIFTRDDTWTPEAAEAIANMVKCSSLFTVEPQYFFRA